MRDGCTNVAGGPQHTGLLDTTDCNCSASVYRRSLGRYVRMECRDADPRAGAGGPPTSDDCQGAVTEGLGEFRRYVRADWECANYATWT